MNDSSCNKIIISNFNIENTIKTKEIYECYVCFEQCPKKLICNCKNLFMHKKCQKKFIILSSQTKCPICKIDYKNVECIEKVKYKLSNLGIDLIFYSILAFTNFSISIVFIFLYYFYIYKSSIFYIMSFICFAISKIIIIYIIYIIVKKMRINRLIIYIPYNTVKKVKILY